MAKNMDTRNKSPNCGYDSTNGQNKGGQNRTQSTSSNKSTNRTSNSNKSTDKTSGTDGYED